MKKLYIRRASELVTCRGSAPKKGAEMADIGLIKNGRHFRKIPDMPSQKGVTDEPDTHLCHFDKISSK